MDVSFVFDKYLNISWIFVNIVHWKSSVLSIFLAYNHNAENIFSCGYI